ncbi:hypothetical protein DFJ73DRAFT_881602 [Zopfochytrium polystomum]|nr:hypothetical protein DFJ73DRAFT_881602 [Zopfochytrium polystomum]
MRWWRESGLSVTCSGNLLDALTAQGRLDVIRWLRDGGDVSGRLAICYPWKFRYSSYPARSVNIDEGYPTSISWHPMAKNVLYVTEPGLIAATRNGHLQVLLWWRQTLKSKFPRRIHSIMDIVSKTGRLEMLDFWRKSGVKLKYSTEAVDDASARGDLAVLRWWEASGLRLKYTEKAIDQASCNHHLHVLNWWRSSRFTLEYSQAAIDSASRNGHAAVLQWWKDSGLELKYSAYAIDGATQSGHVEVLQWWMDSGLEIKCLPVTVNEALSAVDSAVAEWWLTVGLAMLNSRMTATDSAQTTTPAKKRRWWWWS